MPRYIWIVSTRRGPIQAYRDRDVAEMFAEQLRKMGVPVVVNSVAFVESKMEAA